MKGAKEDISMDENTDSKRRIAPSIPANYISILQLQERWINEKERKRKEEEEEEERRRKQQAEEQQRIEEDLKKAEARGKRVDLDEKPLNRSNQKHWDRNSKIKVSIDGGETRCAEKEETSAIRSERGEDAAPGDAGLPVKKRGIRKRYDSKKKRKNQEVAAVKEDFVVECGSIAPPEYTVTENNTPVKEAIPVYRKKGEKATAIETQFEDLSIRRGETKNLKAQTRSSNRNRRNQRLDLHPQRVAVEEEVVECGSIAPPEYIVTENNTPVKDQIRADRKKGEKGTGKKSVGYREKAVTDDATAIETQFEDLFIKRGEESGEPKNRKAQTRPRNRDRPNQRHDLPLRRVGMPKETASMVWVKKGQNERADDRIGSGVKPLHA